jgi:hypothetical protein
MRYVYVAGALGLAILLAIGAWMLPHSQPSPSNAHGLQIVERATCSPGDRPEGGLQGQATLAERFATPQDYNCNLNLVGNFPGEGASWRLAKFGDCAYYSTTPNPALEHPGTVILDVSDVRHPKAVGYLDSKTMRSSNESLRVHEGRKLLIGSDFQGTTLEIYDLSKDCRHPVLISRFDTGDVTLHSGEFTADGLTYYGANWPVSGAPYSKTAVIAVDLTDLAKPRELARWDRPDPTWRTHGVTTTPDGNRVYVATAGLSPYRMTILDSSEIKARKPNPKFKPVSIFVADGQSAGQFATPVTINGHSYLNNVTLSVPGSEPACSGKNTLVTYPAPPSSDKVSWLLDVQDERKPKVATIFGLEVNAPSNCSKIVHELAVSPGLGYWNTFCSFDDPTNAKLAACAFGESGVRIFDIRTPSHIREIAYYKPRAWRTRERKGSYFGSFGGVFEFAFRDQKKKEGTYYPPSNDHTADITLFPIFNGKSEIWFLSADGGFHVARFSDRLKSTEPGLF